MRDAAEGVAIMFNRRKVLKGSAATAAVAVVGGIGQTTLAQEKITKIGMIAPLSGPWARQGELMKMGGDLAVKHINAQGGIRALGGAKLQLLSFDVGDSAEKAKNAAQRMIAQEPDLVAASGAWLSSFTLAVSEVTERADLPLLTLSYADLITDRGFKYVFQTSATAGSQARQALPQIIRLAEGASGKKPKTVAIITDNTAASIASA